MKIAVAAGSAESSGSDDDEESLSQLDKSNPEIDRRPLFLLEMGPTRLGKIYYPTRQ